MEWAERMGTRRAKLRPLTAAALASMLMVVLVGCSDSGGSLSADGPLSSGNGIHDRIPTGSICAPGGRAQTFGDQQYTNYGNQPVVLNRVVLLRPRNEHLIGSYAVPGDQIVGVPGNWPPKYRGIPRGWKHRQPVRGYRVRPHALFNMVIGVVAVDAHREAVSEGILVYYHDASGTYVAKNYFGNIIAAIHHACD
jgi:hypothetical protein